jgi:hypothetical protein
MLIATDSPHNQSRAVIYNARLAVTNEPVGLNMAAPGRP